MATVRGAWACVICLVAGCSAAHSTPQYAANWDRLKVGMPRLAAQELLGEPARASYRKGVSTPYAAAPTALDDERRAILEGTGGAEPNWSERWQFGRFGLGDMADLVHGSDKAYIVWIDDWGRVMGFRQPVTGPRP